MPSEYGEGLTEEDIRSAVLKSGYPLQTEIANILRNDYFVQEEWSYIDKDTGSVRALDMVARRSLWEYKDFQPYARPELHLLIECKKSELPYVFFLSKGKVFTDDFPVVSGLKENNIVVTTDDCADRFNYSLIHLIGMMKSQFCSSPPNHCMTFSKCSRKGKDVILSGEEPYNSIVLPLIKSAQYHIELSRPPRTAVYFDCNFVIPVAVIDAPLVGIVATENGMEIEDISWVRVYRHVSQTGEHRFDRENIFACDIVKKEYFSEYLKSHVSPFADEVSQRVIKHHKVISSGVGFAPGIKNGNRFNIEPILEEQSITKSISRYRLIWKNIVKIVKSEKQA
jgi:hypothetical protein